MRAAVISDPAELAELVPQWDGLAIAAGRPYMTPEWALAWWKHAAPPGAQLRAVAVFDGAALSGMAPCFVTSQRPITYRMLASPICAGVEPLARLGAERGVAAAISESLSSMAPRPALVVLTRLREGSDWPRMLADTWPGERPDLRREPADRAPSLSLAGRTAAEWLPSLPSSKLRAQIRRAQRALARREAEVVLAQPEEMEEQIEIFARLHLRRMEPRGGSEVLGPGVVEMLSDAGQALAAGRRMRLWTVRVDGSTISSQLFLAAGGEVSFWLGAFDDDWARYSPGLVALMAAIEDAITRGDRQLDLGPGMQDYKQRVSDGEHELNSWTLCPRGRGYVRTRARLLPAAARRGLSRVLPERALERYRRLRAAAARH